MRTALQLTGRVERLEAAARQATTPTLGAVIAAILSGKGPRAPVPDEVLAKSATGRLLLERRARAEVDEQGRREPS